MTKAEYAVLKGAKSSNGISENEDIIGFVEAIDRDLVVSGWASNTSYAEELSVSIYSQDTLLCSTTCNQYRPDIIGPEGKALKCGFRVPLPAGSLRRLVTSLRIEAGGKELGGSPINVNLSTKVALQISGIKGGNLLVTVTGWIGAAIKGTLRIDGLPAAFPKIPRSRADFDRNPEVTVSVPIPEKFQDGKIHAYSFEIDHDSAVVRSDESLLQYPEYEFHIDQVSGYQVSGWATRKDRRSPLVIEAIYNGEKAGSSLTNERRPDVASTLGLQGYDQVGFTVGFDRIIPQNGDTVYLRDAETGITFAKFSQVENYAVATSQANALKKSALGASNSSLEIVRGQVSNISPGVTTYFSDLSLYHDPEKSNGSIAVIVPIYSGAVEVVECLESVLGAKNSTPFDLILVNDKSPDANIGNYLRTLEKRSIPNLRIFHRMANAGFSAAVNLGMAAAGSDDVILLNADTVVHDGWLDRIVNAANSDPTIGTVTPFSNNGEICSVPYLCKSLPVSTEKLGAKLDQAAAAQNQGSVTDLPVAIGFCMFIRRACLNEVGFFDAAKWGRGYGEEVDFCLKAASLGWRHVLAGDVFIVHRGAVSFGNEKLERIIESAKKINESYPFYDDTIQRFLHKDPVRTPRRRINTAILRESLPRPRVLHVTHGLGGGTQKYVDDLSAMYRKDGACNVVISFDKYQRCDMRFDGASKAYPDFFAPDHTENYGADETTELLADIRDFEFDVVHLHSPIGVPPDLLEAICDTHEYMTTVHDYAWICPRATLTTSFGKYYGDEVESPAFVSDAIQNPMPGLAKYADLASGKIDKYRDYFSRILEKSKLVLVGGHDVAERLGRHKINANFKSVPHPRAGSLDPRVTGRSAHMRRPGEIIRVGLFGGISDIKGFGTLLECARYAQEQNLPLEFVIFGYTRDDTLLAAFRNVRILGRYKEDEIGDLIEEHQPHIAFFPNQWPETYSYTLSLAFDWKIWPVVTDIGVPAERVRDLEFGTVVSIDANSQELCVELMAAGTRCREDMAPSKAPIHAQSVGEYI